MKPRIKPLDKPRFMESVRQKWLAVLLASGLVILFADIYYEIDPTVYLSYIGTVGTTFIIGSSIDSALKIQSAIKKQDKEPAAKEEEISEE